MRRILWGYVDLAVYADYPLAALNGAMAHLYVRPTGSASWLASPSETELGVVAEMLRLFLMDGYQFNDSGARVRAGTANAAFGVVDLAKQDRFAQLVGLDRLLGSVDIILARVGDQYRIYDGLEPDPLGPPMSVPTIVMRTRPLSFLESASDVDGGTKYVRLMKRVNEMNRADRTGDILLIMKDSTGLGPPDRFATGVACRGWHASLNRSDSYIPLILSYPGGNRRVGGGVGQVVEKA